MLSEHGVILEEGNGHMIPQVLRDKNYKTVTPDFSDIDTNAFIYLLVHLFNKN